MSNKAAHNLFLFQMAFKVFLIVSTMGMSVHCANLLMGVRICVVEFTIILPLVPFLLLYSCSYILKLCRLSRWMLIYNYIVSVCIYLQKNYDFFGQYLTLMRWLVMSLGLVLSVLLIRKMINHKC